MSTTYYICRKHEYERSEAISSYTDRIRRTLFSYLDASLPPELKDEVQLTDDLEGATLHHHQQQDRLAQNGNSGGWLQRNG